MVTNAANGCTNTAGVQVVANVTPPGAAAVGGTLTCVATSITLQGSSNDPDAVYAWTGPNGFASAQQNPVATLPGTYFLVTTSPANGCTSQANAVVVENVTPPVVSAQGGELTCAVDSVTLSAAFAPANAMLAWSGPGGFSSNEASPTVAQPGVYALTATNPLNGCTAQATAQVALNTTQPSINANAGELSCLVSEAALTTSSDAPNATYLWTGPGGFSADTANTVTTLPGSYEIAVTNPDNGCTNAAAVTVAIDTLSPLALAAPPPALNCNNATVQIDATASSQGNQFGYQWTTANGNIVAGANTLTPVVDAPGIYELLISNSANGCMAQTQVSVSQTPAPVASAEVVSAIACFGGQGVLTGSGSAGLPPYAYL